MTGFVGWDASDAIGFQPSQESLPAVLGLLFAITGPVVGKERVRGVRVEHDLGRASSLLESRLHFLDVAGRNAPVSSAIEAQNWGFQARG